MPEETWRTSDMSLAAYLEYQGHTCVDMEWEEESCFFVFEHGDDLVECAADFVGDRAQVKPRRYNMVFGSLKKKMFANKRAQRI